MQVSNCRYCLLNANALVAVSLSSAMSHTERFPFKLIALLIGHFSRVFCRLPLVGVLVAALALVLRICANFRSPSFTVHNLCSTFYVYTPVLHSPCFLLSLQLKEYELSEVFNFAEDDRKYETVKTQTHLEAEHE